MIAAEMLSEIILPDVSLRLVESHLHSLSAPGENTNTYDQGGALAFYDKVASAATLGLSGFMRLESLFRSAYPLTSIAPCIT